MAAACGFVVGILETISDGESRDSGPESAIIWKTLRLIAARRAIGKVMREERCIPWRRFAWFWEAMDVYGCVCEMAYVFIYICWTGQVVSLVPIPVKVVVSYLEGGRCLGVLSFGSREELGDVFRLHDSRYVNQSEGRCL